MVWLWRSKLPPTFSSLLFLSLLHYVSKHCHPFSHVAPHIQKRVTVHTFSVPSFRSLLCTSLLSYSQHSIMVKYCCAAHVATIVSFCSQGGLETVILPLQFSISFSVHSPYFLKLEYLKNEGLDCPYIWGFPLRNSGEAASVTLCAHSCASHALCLCASLHYKCTTMSQRYCIGELTSEATKSAEPGWFTLLGVTQS